MTPALLYKDPLGMEVWHHVLRVEGARQDLFSILRHSTRTPDGLHSAEQGWLSEIEVRHHALRRGTKKTVVSHPAPLYMDDKRIPSHG